MSDGGIFDEPDEGSHDEELPEVEPTVALPVSVDKSKKQLICVADQTGNPLVATAQYDKSGQLSLLEPYRRPSQKEWLHLTQTGQIVKQGNGSVKVNSTVGQTDPSTEPSWKKPVKIAAAVLGIGAVVGGGIWIYKKSRNQNPSEPPELQEPDEPDDDEDDDDDGDDD